MLNQFYNYIVKHIYDCFNDISEHKLNAGDRFFLYLDRQDDVDSIIEAFSQLDYTQPFTYKHKHGDQVYETIALKFTNHEVLLVIAFTSEHVHPDFLVTLRNEVGEQKGKWENTALLSIVSTQLDSILGGSSDLLKEGMPLHPHRLFKVLNEQIDSNQSLNKVEKIILKNQMEQIVQDHNFLQITIFEFEEIIKVLENGTITDEDYRNFSLFKDPDLITYTGTALSRRLEKNRELFEFVRNGHEYGFDESQLERMFSTAGSNKILGENWENITYQEIYKYHQEALEQRSKAKIELNEIHTNNSFVIWDRHERDSAAGRRKRHVIIFNDGHEEVTFTANFSIEGGGIKSLSSQYTNVDRKFRQSTSASTGRFNITIKIKTEKNQVTFSRVTYRHDSKAALGAEFLIAVVPINRIFIEPFKTSYLIDPNEKVIKIPYTGEKLIIGDQYDSKLIQLTEYGQSLEYESDHKLIIEPLPEAFNDEDQLQFQLKFCESNTTLPFKLIHESPESVPINPFRIWKMKREFKEDFQYVNERLIFKTQMFYITPKFKQFCEWEFKWLESNFKSAELISGQLVHFEPDIELSDELKEAYSRYLTYFTSRSSIPSLCHMSDELQIRASEYVDAYIKELKSFPEGVPAGKRGRDLFRLGTLAISNGLYLTPFHPLMVAYQLQLYQDVQQEELENSILAHLRPDALVPYFYIHQDNILRPSTSNDVIEWLEFRPVNQVSISNANKYLARLIADKIKQFTDHFSYLFKSKAALKINLINLENDHEVIRGIINYIIGQIKIVGVESIVPIEVSIYRKSTTMSSFDLFSQVQNTEDFTNRFHISLSKINEYDESDILRAIRNNLLYFKKNEDDKLGYAHISFYKMGELENYAVLPMKNMSSGLALGGLYSHVPSMKGPESYTSGFGNKFHTNTNENRLINLAVAFNELCANLRNDGHDAYINGNAIVSITTIADEEQLRRIYQASHWVTFIDSNVDLEFFSTLEKNLVVIHYNDQYSSSNKYDAITVTNKTDQYYTVIRDFLEAKIDYVTNDSIERVIQAFNTFNGEWLLRIISEKGHYPKEKLSIVSGIKYALSYFDYKDIIWVPISLEEILRVAGAVGLDKKDGIFSAKNLGSKGVHSDDLLLIGLENQDNELKFHFYPIEVKTGYINQNVINKAKEQVIKTRDLIISTLNNQSPKKTFTSKFYRYFFVQLFLTNANKLHVSKFWPEKNYNISEEVISRLLHDNFSLSFALEKYIGQGAILTFERDGFHRSSVLEDGIRILKLPIEDGFQGIVKSMSEMYRWIQQEENDFVKEDMLSYQYKKNDHDIQDESNHVQAHQEVAPSLEDTSDQEEYIKDNYEVKNDGHQIDAEKRPNNLIPLENDVSNDTQEVKFKELNDQSFKENEVKNDGQAELSDIRILIGKAENSNRKIYWEFGHNDLPNRHLIISGKSGQGKTYFMQCLLLELSKRKISSIVIDYTEGFLPNQLEPEFKNYLGKNLIQKIVYNEQFPINPFKKNERDIGGITLPESDTDVAERIKSVFSSVYSTLGIQQLNAIYEATLNGLQKYGEDMNLVILKQCLENDSSSYAKTALSQIRPLIDRNPFSQSSNLNWGEILHAKGKVWVIQLTGYPRDVQLIITEFILWDLWNYSLRFGHKSTPIPVLMDEAQNLDHSERSPSAKILTEGRKFGWSGWYATQFLKSQLNNDEIARLQNAALKVYFAQPEQEISHIAGTLSTDPQERKSFETKLASLRKGQCIVYGPNKIDGSNNLSAPMPIVVNISPLSERID